MSGIMQTGAPDYRDNSCALPVWNALSTRPKNGRLLQSDIVFVFVLYTGCVYDRSPMVKNMMMIVVVMMMVMAMVMME